MDDVEVYDPDYPNEGWVIESYIPESKFRFASATYDGSIYVFGGQSSYTANCSGYDYCFPVTNHTWAFTETAESQNSRKRKLPVVAIVLIVLFFSVLGFFGCLGFVKYTEEGKKLLGNTPSSSEVPVDEPKEGVEITDTTLATAEGDETQV